MMRMINIYLSFSYTILEDINNVIDNIWGIAKDMSIEDNITFHYHTRTAFKHESYNEKTSKAKSFDINDLADMDMILIPHVNSDKGRFYDVGKGIYNIVKHYKNTKSIFYFSRTSLNFIKVIGIIKYASYQTNHTDKYAKISRHDNMNNSLSELFEDIFNNYRSKFFDIPGNKDTIEIEAERMPYNSILDSDEGLLLLSND